MKKPVSHKICKSRKRPAEPLLSRTLISARGSVLALAGMVIVLPLFQETAVAATRTKQNNGTALNLPASWDALPNSADIALWNATVTGANSPALGADLSLLGLKVVDPGGLVTVVAGNALTVGASGLDLSAATNNLSLNCGLTLQGQQSWTAAAGRSLNLSGPFIHSGATVDFSNFHSSAVLGTLANDASGILGPWATTGVSTSLNYVKTSAGLISPYTGQTLATAANLSNVTNSALNYSCAAGATLTSAITANTLRYSGGVGTLVNSGFGTTLNGLMHAGTGALTSSGTGALMIGNNRELVITSNAQSISISNSIIDNTAGASSLTYSGASGGNLTLAGANSYSGGTTVNSGSIILGAQNGFGSGPVTLAAGSVFTQTGFEGNNSAGALSNPLILSGVGNITMNMPFGDAKDVWLSGIISGTGGLTTQGGTRKLTLTGNNTFSGGVRLTSEDNKVQISHSNALGTGTFRSESSLNSSFLVAMTDISTGTGVSNKFDIASGAYLNVSTDGDFGAVGLRLSGPITSSSGIGGLHKNGNGTLELTGANTYTGLTKVEFGPLAFASAGALGGGALDIGLSAVVALNFAGTRHITALTYNSGSPLAAGTYGSASSGAAIPSSYFTGTGTVTVGGAPFAVTTTTVALTSGVTPAGVGASFTFTATVAGNAPSGNVAFYDGVTLIGTQALSGTTAGFTTTSLALGTHQITARYLGNTANDPSFSTAIPISIEVYYAPEILSFTFPGLSAATISGTNINVTVPFATNITSLAPTYTLASGSSCTPASSVAQDFSSPKNYVVSAAGFPNKTYTVTVTKAASSPYQTWNKNASFFILTDSVGANIASGPPETDFPLLLRLNSNNFDFSQAQSNGGDIRFTNASDSPLSYQIEQWDAQKQVAAIWIKVPIINPNSRQELKMYWGKTGATSESNGMNVFNATNGFVSVMHLNDNVADTVGTLSPQNIGTTVSDGLIGKSRTFNDGNGILGGTNLTSLPSGTGPHSTEVWFKSDSSNFDIFDWAREDSGKKVQIRLVTPPRIVIDGNFAGVEGNVILSPSKWHHVVNTFSNNTSRLYIDGVIDSSNYAAVEIKPPSSLWLGGWQNTYHFVGDMDEARLSRVARSANWIKMEYENQKVQQTLVGSLVQPGNTFAATPSSVTLAENSSANLYGQAGGAQKISWIEIRNGVETLLSTDSALLLAKTGRETGNQNYIIQFKGVYATGIQTVNIPITVIDTLPDPEFVLTGPSTWNGRTPAEFMPTITNMADLQSQDVSNFKYTWTVSGVAVNKQITPGVLNLTRAQGNGEMKVTLTMENGGKQFSQSKIVTVQQPIDEWVERIPGANEKPVNKQFFARDFSGPNNGKGIIYYNGTEPFPINKVYLNVYKLEQTGLETLTAYTKDLTNGKYSFAAPILGGKYTYRVEYGTFDLAGLKNPPSASVTDLVCGDAYIIEGQSNALAVDNHVTTDNSDKWIRTYGKVSNAWGYALNKDPRVLDSVTNEYNDVHDFEIGVWGFIFAKRLLASQNMPICIINGAVGGTRIDQHRPNPVNHSLLGPKLDGNIYPNIYANFYNRVVAAKLTHGIRAVLWHQGEQDQGSGGIDGDYDYKFYQQYFVDISAAWKDDFPNILNYYVFQIWPAACGDNTRNDQLRDVQRSLSSLYSNMRLMSTLGIIPGSSCHYELEGYQKFSDLIGPLVEQGSYGINPNSILSAANLKKAYFTSPTHNQIALEFDQDIAWNPGATSFHHLSDGKTVLAGSASGKTITLQLNSASTAKTITYLKGELWQQQQANLIYGTNGIAALTFADVEIEASGLASQSINFGSLVTKKLGDGSFTLGATASSGLLISYLSSDPSVASISGNTVTILRAGVATITASQVGNSVFNAASSVDQLLTVNGPSYLGWASDLAQNLPKAVNGLLDDPDHDGISNLVEFTLGGAPTISAQSILPKFAQVSGSWVFEYNRSKSSLGNTQQSVQYGSDLMGWTLVEIPATSAGNVNITPVNSAFDNVKATIPAGNAKTFARLKVTQN